MSNEDLKAFFAFWDFCCAFPSVGHLGLFACIEAYGFPSGFCALVKGMYHMCFAYSANAGCMMLLWLIRSGVL